MEKEYILAIDTIEDETGVGLYGPNSHLDLIWVSHKNQSEELLPNINKLLQENNIKPIQLKWVVVNRGPGSFTGLRIGISIANAFGFALNIPVVGKANLSGNTGERLAKLSQLTPKQSDFKQILPEYGRAPRITQPKNKLNPLK